MKQQINFYEYLPKDTRQKITLKMAMILYACFSILLFLDYSLEKWNLHKKSVQLTQLNTTLNAKQLELANLAQRYPSLNMNELEASVIRLQKELESKTKIVSELSYQILFSDYLLGLSNASLDGMWLNEFVISSGENGSFFRGRAVDAATVQQFMEELQRQPSYAALPLTLQELTQAKEKNMNFFTFIISSKSSKDT